MTIKSKTELLINAFNTYSMVVSHSPLLSNPPEFRDDGIIYISWVDDEGDHSSIEIEACSLNEANFVGESVWLTDITGEEVEISFYETKPVKLVEYQELPIKSPQELVAETKTKGEQLVTRAHPPVKAFQFNINTPQEQQLEGIELSLIHI